MTLIEGCAGNVTQSLLIGEVKKRVGKNGEVHESSSTATPVDKKSDSHIRQNSNSKKPSKLRSHLPVEGSTIENLETRLDSESNDRDACPAAEASEITKEQDSTTTVTKLPRNRKFNCLRAGSSSSNHMPSSEPTWSWWFALAGLVILALATRLYKIEEPDHVCWDETHFGKFGSWYINRTFFFDVHPPLGKMMIGLFGALSGYNGSFPFLKPGDKFGDTNYVGMRVCCVLLGACLVPFAFIIVWDLTKSMLSSTLAASFILFDVGLLTLSQYILLDPILMFFILGSVLCAIKFRSCHDSAFALKWWIWLTLTGVFLACSFSVKFVGLFIVIYVGGLTAWDLWNILGDLRYPIVHTAWHFIARAVCLIVLPALLYMLFFYVHLRVLNKSGTGDGYFSSAFQSQLQGNSLHNASMPKDVAYGAILTLKNHRTGGGYLHSHWHLYPEGLGAKQQQVTSYTHKDDNNKWMIKQFDVNIEPNKATGKIQLVKHGDAVRLEHLATRRNLHSHKEPAPMTKKHYQVTGYGENGVGDANDVWRIEIVDGKEGDVVTTITSKLKFIHYLTGCALYSHNKALPKWAYEQMEVSCSLNLRDPKILWNVEDNYFPRRLTSPVLLLGGLLHLPLNRWHRCWLANKYEGVGTQFTVSVVILFILLTARYFGLVGGLETSLPIKSLCCELIWQAISPLFLVPNVSVEGYAPNFLSKFVESHAIMLQGNSGLKPKEGEVTSKPWQWPINYRGQYFSGNQYRIYLLGNPLIWWGNLLFLFFYIALSIYHAIKLQRGYQHSLVLRAHWEKMVYTCNLLFVGWCLHYVPFWFMGRILYYHHYFPALMFSSLISGVVLDFLIHAICSYIPVSLSSTFHHGATGLILSCVAYSFYQYSPLAYGMQGPTTHEANSTLSALRLLDSWEF